MTSNSNDDMRCKCKKTNCLKLYCDCFAAGLYCDKACSCQECFNSPDYEDTVDETRQHIEFRNPLAFFPKITPSPTSYNEETDQLDLIAGKHRKGCSCRKSVCVQKYCECYRANVGCSAKCRCEGCQNVFGRRRAIDETAKKDLQPVGSEFPLSDFHNPHNLSPWTPSQHLSHQNNTSTGRYISSSGYANSDVMFGASIRNDDMVTLNQQLYPNHDESMNQFTPPNATEFNGRHLNSSFVGDNFSSVVSSPSSTPESPLVGPKVYDSNDRPNTGAYCDSR